MNWHDKIDWEPIVWFVISAGFIFAAHFIVKSGNESLGTLVAALGGAGIARVRSSKPRVTGQPDQEQIFGNVQ